MQCVTACPFIQFVVSAVLKDGHSPGKPRIDHSKGKVIAIVLINEDGPGLLQFNVQQTSLCKNSRQQGQN